MKLPKPSKVTVEQWTKVLKAWAYSFVSVLILALPADVRQWSKALLAGAAVSAVNAVLVLVKQLFTEAK